MERKSFRVYKHRKKAIAVSDFVKVSDEELEIISGAKDHKEGVAVLHELGVEYCGGDTREKRHPSFKWEGY